jgi:hypothetical protein
LQHAFTVIILDQDRIERDIRPVDYNLPPAYSADTNVYSFPREVDLHFGGIYLDYIGLYIYDI